MRLWWCFRSLQNIMPHKNAGWRLRLTRPTKPHHTVGRASARAARRCWPQSPCSRRVAASPYPAYLTAPHRRPGKRTCRPALLAAE
ncbi:hypothetical protein, partial [Leclercia barmai]|uniref:hypothetical protein n=1 Tax=Leclercia barmai TaxID=2785629 RepID=UPI001CA9D5F6